MTTRREPTCTGCTHYQGRDDFTGNLRCSSFQTEIPRDILLGADPHVSSRNGEPTYKPATVDALARFIADWVIPVLNPSLGPEWARRTKVNEHRILRQPDK